MAFVFKSDRILGKENSPKTEVGPGQYLPQGFDKNIIEGKIPFFSTTFREIKIKKEDIPGPGSYEYDDKYEKFANMILEKKKKSPNNLKTFEIINTDNIDPFTIIINKENQKDVCFLSKEKRFKELPTIYNPAPGKYDKHEPMIFLKNSIKDKKRKKFLIPEKNNLTLTRYDKSTGSPNRISTIPAKHLSYGYDINEHGELYMKDDPDKNLKHKGELGDTVGPGSYETFKSKQWFKNMVSWERNSKSPREKISENYKESKEFNIPNIENNNLIQINKSNNNNMIVNSISANNDNYVSKEKKKIQKDKIFKHFREKRQKLLDLKETKTSYEDELVNKHVLHQDPGPGYYNTDFATTAFKNSRFPEKFQTFGSSSLRFQDNPLLDVGPGSYFKDDQRLDKIKLKQYLNEKINFSVNAMSIREDIKKERLSNYETRMGINGMLNKQKTTSEFISPGPGWYDTQTNAFLKKNLSTNSQFGSIQKRFVEPFSNETPGPGSYVGFPKSQTASLGNSLNKILVKPKKLKTNNEISDLLGNPKIDQENEKNKIPSVGSYNPDILFSLGYKVAKNVNKFNSTVAPFSSIEKRFMCSTKTAADNVGPGQYYKERILRNTVSNSPPFNTSSDRYGNFNNTHNVNVSGPGSYNVSSYFDWNKKSYNIQYI